VDRGWGIAIDSANNAYVAGDTMSPNFPTANAVQPGYGSGLSDAFVTKLNASGSALAYSTFLGGSSFDEGRGVAVDGSGNAYVTGSTSSDNFPTTAGVFQPQNGGGLEHHDDAFVSKIADSASPPPTPTPNPAPATPNNLVATASSSSQMNLTWTDNSSNENGFRIERCQGAGCTNFAQIATIGANTTSYSNTGLAAGTSYRYRVRAYNNSGNSGYSNTVEATTQAAGGLPAAPSGLTATAVSRSRINLTWTDNANNESGYKIYRCKGVSCTNFSQIATVGANTKTFSNTKLTSNSTYRYRVLAYNAAGNSAYSNIASAKTFN
jgi:hypothetical protein